MTRSHVHPLSRVTRAAALALACLATHAGATAPSDVRFSRTDMVVEHVTASSSRPYVDVKKDLETRLGRLDDSIRAKLKAGDVDALRAELTKAAGKDGLVIHYVGVHGDWLILKGARGNVTEYFIGNILSAVEMTSANPAAGLYAPLRVVVYAGPKGGSVIEYDRPSTQLSQYHDADIDAMGRSLDDRLDRLVASTLSTGQ
jgi:uncharacterized protein (DUF302 family)